MQKENVSVTVDPGQKKVSGTQGETLINLLAENGIFLRSDCGGKGLCRKCTVELPTEGEPVTTTACTYKVEDDLSIRIPESSLMSAHVLKKASVSLPSSFTDSSNSPGLKLSGQEYGIAVDLGTTTIAIYLCSIKTRTVLSSIAVKNPQSLCGDDVMSRIGYIGNDTEKLSKMQQMVTSAIGWGVRKLLQHIRIDQSQLARMVVVGNPTMIHIFSGVSPHSIGVSPYSPAFYEARTMQASSLSSELPEVNVYTLPQISGFIGGDILAAAMGAELETCASGTLLIDLGTNGELMLQENGKIYATSCATGPAFEGASLSCGIQAVPGAIDRVRIADDGSPSCTFIPKNGTRLEKPAGICGSGIISATAALLSSGIIDNTGLYSPDHTSTFLERSDEVGRFVLFCDGNGDEVSISQKDIRSIQLGKAALRSGIDCLLEAAGRNKPESIIVAGAFGSHLDKNDLLTLGMVPDIRPDHIFTVGNSAGAGAIMALCDENYLEQANILATNTKVIQLTEDASFQNIFISHLSF